MCYQSVEAEPEPEPEPELTAVLVWPETEADGVQLW